MPTRVVYVHGMGGSPDDWRPVQARQPGFALALEAASTTPEECAAALADDVAKLVSGSFALCGYSMGARIAILATKLLVEKKKKPAGLILVSGGFGSGDDDERAARLRADEGWAELATRDSDAFWTKWYEQDLFRTFHTLPEATRASWLETRKAVEPAMVANQLRALGPGRHGDLWPVLQSLVKQGVSVLYVAGALDAKYVAVAERVRSLPGALVEIVPEAGHLLPLEAPDALALRVAKFIR